MNMASKQVSFRTEESKVAAVDDLAASLDRDRSYVINQALDAYLELQRWQVEHIREAKAEADAGGPFIPHEEVMTWIASMGTESELPPPEPSVRLRSRKRARRK
jgi:predicted transcriptional regulator